MEDTGSSDKILFFALIVAILVYLYYKFTEEHKSNEVYITYTVVMPSAKSKLSGKSVGHEVDTKSRSLVETARSYFETAVDKSNVETAGNVNKTPANEINVEPTQSFKETSTLRTARESSEKEQSQIEKDRIPDSK